LEYSMLHSSLLFELFLNLGGICIFFFSVRTERNLPHIRSTKTKQRPVYSKERFFFETVRIAFVTKIMTRNSLHFLLRSFILLLINCHAVVVLATHETVKDPPVAKAERISYGGGKIRASDALYRLDYDIVLAVGVVIMILVLWLRAMYLHVTVKSVSDKYKPKYH